VILEVEGGHPYYCIERDTVEIFVDVIVSIDVNTVFTPNNDGFNDFFEIKTSAVRELTCNIYNQWGNKVYQIDEVNGRWDGKNKGGAEMPDGTYFYALSAYGFDNKDHERSGDVLLLRNASQAYPNPVSGRVKVEVAGILEAPVRFIVYSVEGQVALSGDVDDPLNVDIDLAPLPRGIYLLKVFDDKRHYYVRIIKN
jgi:gliding motility-associated-like protein